MSVLGFFVLLAFSVIGGFVWAVIDFIFMILEGKVKIKWP